MKHTREQLENMSDEEINYALADSLYENPRNCIHMGFDYEDWAVIMPLAVEHKLIINLNLGTGAGVDSKGVTHLCSDYNKPQRAIACCLLMMELK